jgi:hypothetical protein
LLSLSLDNPQLLFQHSLYVLQIHVYVGLDRIGAAVVGVGAIRFTSLKKFPPDSEMSALASVRLGLSMREQTIKVFMMTSETAGATKDLSTSQVDGNRGVAEQSLFTIYIMGKAYEVPVDATIMGAIEYAGHQIIRGAGCREGYCGACATIYRLPGDYKIRTGLACMTMVEEGMSLTQVPYVPGEKAIYDIEKLKPNVSAIQQMYPSVFRCVACAGTSGHGLYPGRQTGRHCDGDGPVFRLRRLRVVHVALPRRNHATPGGHPGEAPVWPLSAPG